MLVSRPLPPLMLPHWTLSGEKAGRRFHLECSTHRQPLRRPYIVRRLWIPRTSSSPVLYVGQTPSRVPPTGSGTLGAKCYLDSKTLRMSLRNPDSFPGDDPLGSLRQLSVSEICHRRLSNYGMMRAGVKRNDQKEA